MVFKFKPERANLYLMITMFILLGFNTIVWLILRKYLFFSIMLIFTIIFINIYFMTKYELTDKYFITYLGFIKIKINYNKIKNVEVINNKINIKLKYFTIDIYPLDKDKFVKEINKRRRSNK